VRCLSCDGDDRFGELLGWWWWWWWWWMNSRGRTCSMEKVGKQPPPPNNSSSRKGDYDVVGFAALRAGDRWSVGWAVG